MSRTLFAISLLMISAPALAHRPVTQGIPVGIGQTFRVNGLKITPIRVIEDSRCPMNARCIWAGTVRITARIREGHQWQTRELELGKPFMIRGRALTLSDVAPPRVAGGPVRKLRYRFAFTFEPPLPIT